MVTLWNQGKEIEATALVDDESGGSVPNSPENAQAFADYLNWLQRVLPCPTTPGWIPHKWLGPADVQRMPERYIKQTGKKAFQKRTRTSVYAVYPDSVLEALDPKQVLRKQGLDWKIKELLANIALDEVPPEDAFKEGQRVRRTQHNPFGARPFGGNPNDIGDLGTIIAFHGRKDEPKHALYTVRWDRNPISSSYCDHTNVAAAEGPVGEAIDPKKVFRALHVKYALDNSPEVVMAKLGFERRKYAEGAISWWKPLRRIAIKVTFPDAPGGLYHFSTWRSSQGVWRVMSEYPPMPWQDVANRLGWELQEALNPKRLFRALVRPVRRSKAMYRILDWLTENPIVYEVQQLGSEDYSIFIDLLLPQVAGEHVIIPFGPFTKAEVRRLQDHPSLVNWRQSQLEALDPKAVLRRMAAYQATLINAGFKKNLASSGVTYFSRIIEPTYFQVVGGECMSANYYHLVPSGGWKLDRSVPCADWPAVLKQLEEWGALGQVSKVVGEALCPKAVLRRLRNKNVRVFWKDRSGREHSTGFWGVADELEAETHLRINLANGTGEHYLPITILRSELMALGEATDPKQVFWAATKTIAPTRDKGKDVSGRLVRLLCSRYPVEGVYIWDNKGGENARTMSYCAGILQISFRNYGLIRQEWACFGVLAQTLLDWRNLEGAKLWINGQPSEKVSRSHPQLKEYSDEAWGILSAEAPVTEALDPKALFRRLSAGRNMEVDFGFAISVSDQDYVEDRAREIGVVLEEEHWTALTVDGMVLERNCRALLNRAHIRVQDEGHDARGALIGTAWAHLGTPAWDLVLRWVDSEGELLSCASSIETVFNPASERLWRGVSSLGKSVLDVQIEFFGLESLLGEACRPALVEALDPKRVFRHSMRMSEFITPQRLSSVLRPLGFGPLNAFEGGFSVAGMPPRSGGYDGMSKTCGGFSFYVFPDGEGGANILIYRNYSFNISSLYDTEKVSNMRRLMQTLRFCSVVEALDPKRVLRHAIRDRYWSSDRFRQHLESLGFHVVTSSSVQKSGHPGLFYGSFTMDKWIGEKLYSISPSGGKAHVVIFSRTANGQLMFSRGFLLTYGELGHPDFIRKLVAMDLER